MENYTKLNSKPIIEDPKEPWDIYVASGSKVKVVISKALKTLEGDSEKVVLIGFGPTLNKTITCVEIIKRKNQDLYQNNKIYFKKRSFEKLQTRQIFYHSWKEHPLFRIEDTWVPNQEGLDRLTVTRNVPAIKIVLSKIPLDVNEPGYQAPVSAARGKPSGHRKQKSGHSGRKDKEITKKKQDLVDHSKRKDQMPKTKRFRASKDK